MTGFKSAFSLVELSIVLVILGLLVGGVLSGQSLIRAAELRSVSTDYQRFVAATYSFRDKYFALPGDMTNATSFWPTAAGNGNGDGNLNNAPAVSVAGEIYGFWQQLALAGLVEGTYSGLSGSATGFHSIIGTNVPRSKVSNAGWSSVYWGQVDIVSTQLFEGSYTNNLVFGAASSLSITDSGAIKVEDAWNMDTKLDDGLPGQGKVRVYENFSACHNAGTSTTVALAASARYTLTSTAGAACHLVFNM